MASPMQSALVHLSAGQSPDDLDQTVLRDAFRSTMDGSCAPEQLGAFLALLSVPKLTPSCLALFAAEMRAVATPCDLSHLAGEFGGNRFADVVGTGGDGKDTFNISTAAAFVLAGAGVPVVKHGNRAASSKVGSADVLEALGGTLDADAARVGSCLHQAGLTFLFAHSFHPGMKFVAGARTCLKFRTVFNLLGPLTNPARPRRGLLGVCDESVGDLYGEAVRRLLADDGGGDGDGRVFVAFGCEGLDEVSCDGESILWDVTPAAVEKRRVRPASFGLPCHPLSAVGSFGPAGNATEMRQILAGAGGREAVRDMILLNAAAAILSATLEVGAAWGDNDLKASVAVARESISSGRALECLDKWVAHSKG